MKLFLQTLASTNQSYLSSIILTSVYSLQKLIFVRYDVIAFILDAIYNGLRTVGRNLRFRFSSNNYLIVFLNSHRRGSEQLVKWNIHVSRCKWIVQFLNLIDSCRFYFRIFKGMDWLMRNWETSLILFFKLGRRLKLKWLWFVWFAFSLVNNMLVFILSWRFYRLMLWFSIVKQIFIDFMKFGGNQLLSM